MLNARWKVPKVQLNKIFLLYIIRNTYNIIAGWIFYSGEKWDLVPEQVEQSGSSIPTKILGIASKCCVDLCVGTDSEDGFSSGYILVSFQNLTSSCCQDQLATLNWTEAMPTPCSRLGKNLPLKEVDWR